jgi:GAF domain-containing protein
VSATDNPVRIERAAKILASSEAALVLDSFVVRAQNIAHTPIALATIVTRHLQYFLAHRGLPSELLRSCATSKRNSFCQFVISTGGPFEVSDAIDSDIAPQELVEQFGIRSYFGVPLEVFGSVIGSLNVIDVIPREWDARTKSELVALTARANEELDRIASDAMSQIPKQGPAGARGLLRAHADQLLRYLEALKPAVVHFRQAAERGTPFGDADLPMVRMAEADLKDARDLLEDMLALARNLGVELGAIEREELDRGLHEVLADLTTLVPIWSLLSDAIRRTISASDAGRTIIVAQQAFDIPCSAARICQGLITLLDES